MNKPLLSICIPTFNRSKYLRKCIESIICQKEFVDGKVEIVISDNASQDDTGAVVNAYLKQFENVFYYRNSENLRDQNFPMVLSEGHGILRRLCNDTVVFRPGSLAGICRIIESSRKDRPFICWANGAGKRKQDITYDDFRGYVRDVSVMMTAISCFSLWDDACTELRNDTDGCELSLWQVRKALEIAHEKNAVLICNSPYTDTLPIEKKNVSYGLFQVFYKNYFRLLNPYFANGALSADDFVYLEKDLLFRFFADWCAKWELQANNFQFSDTENLKEAVWKQYKDKPYWFRFQIFYRLKLWKLKAKRLLRNEGMA